MEIKFGYSGFVDTGFLVPGCRGDTQGFRLLLLAGTYIQGRRATAPQPLQCGASLTIMPCDFLSSHPHRKI
jgi:hypothetical protein